MGRGRAYYLAQENRPLTPADRRNPSLVEAYIRYGGDPYAVERYQAPPAQPITINNYYFGSSAATITNGTQPGHASQLTLATNVTLGQANTSFGFGAQQQASTAFTSNTTQYAVPATNATFAPSLSARPMHYAAPPPFQFGVSTPQAPPVFMGFSAGTHHKAFVAPPTYTPPMQQFRRVSTPYAYAPPAYGDSNRITDLNPTPDGYQQRAGGQSSDSNMTEGRAGDWPTIKREEDTDHASDTRFAERHGFVNLGHTQASSLRGGDSTAQLMSDVDRWEQTLRKARTPPRELYVEGFRGDEFACKRRRL